MNIAWKSLPLRLLNALLSSSPQGCWYTKISIKLFVAIQRATLLCAIAPAPRTVAGGQGWLPVSDGSRGIIFFLPHTPLPRLAESLLDPVHGEY